MILHESATETIEEGCIDCFQKEISGNWQQHCAYQPDDGNWLSRGTVRTDSLAAIIGCTETNSFQDIANNI